jgi:PadR family transcriptional regulator, regulatory protein AphA
MAKENKSKYAILGMLALGEKSGYDIRKSMEASISNFWSESYGQIYPILKQLLAEELVTASSEKADSKREKIVYKPTEKGMQELQVWLQKPVDPVPVREELLLKIFFGRFMDNAALLQHLQNERESLQKTMRKYQQIEAFLKAKETEGQIGVLYSLLTLNMGKHETQAKLAWCEETIAALEKRSNKNG